MNIIATGVTSLDEARYFSAMGVAWLGFDGSKLAPEQIKSITDWVVGPKLFIEIITAEEEQLFETANKVHLDAIALPLTEDAPSWYDGLILRTTSFPEEQEILNKTFNMHLLIRCADMTENDRTLKILQRICSNNTCWIEYDPSASSPFALIEKLPAKGMILRCTGNVASDAHIYAEYDAFFERFT